ncbi:MULTISPECIES: aspartate 1-decarboxylase [unclassified Clostridium]|uniref:aspartate 1-decarboxylase n=1 Tax=unclassified Clostridium TaxID=2614128 RepID=UPI003F91A960
MRITMLKSKIHRATVTEANLNYVGSITIDKDLMNKSNILEYEKVQIVDIDNGSRFETYVIAGEKGSGVICLNGAAARMVQKGDKVIIMSYCNLSIDEAKNFNPTVLFVNKNNSISEITNYERHGEII